MKSIKISIPSLIENIKIIESFIDNAKERFHIDDDIYGNIMISVTECVSNAILHGNKGDASKNVDLELHFDEEEIKFIIKDEGSGFEFDELKDPTAPENLEKAGGRGIFIMKHLADDVSFEEEGRKTILKFYMY
ncbi:anti-sigma regulatory factor (Ser/Thr protein kinase) [Belliella baltica DSM 15883]|uniref:Anti-sigma regulatory factor (Ser/Thr protein kinase) n=1 Tax=Belliella baltica (strain DSM 15883 / CIP 108006 / LMG 21964 / BA134) TaxID=866536 RepID=I3Z329_BELBD|nr:ATP-binding protein [Belliella baltica]AFL83647.1 anti-sigma regulatory factor (Ser/Thr protein kinase) [Belliella baltica DSM 15883]